MNEDQYKKYIKKMVDDIDDLELLGKIYRFVHRLFLSNGRK